MRMSAEASAALAIGRVAMPSMDRVRAAAEILAVLVDMEVVILAFGGSWGSGSCAVR